MLYRTSIHLSRTFWKTAIYQIKHLISHASRDSFPSRGSQKGNAEKTRGLRKGVQIRETAGFDRTFFAHTSQKNPEIHQVFPDFSILSGRKISRSKLLCTQKESFSCRTRREAQEYWLCIPSIFNEVRRGKILFALPYPYSARPKIPRVIAGGTLMRDNPSGGSASRPRHRRSPARRRARRARRPRRRRRRRRRCGCRRPGWMRR